MARSRRGGRAAHTAYAIPTVPLTLAPDSDAAAAAAWPIIAGGGTVALKVVSPDMVHKSDIGGVRLDLALARDLIARTRVARHLEADRDVPAADTPVIALTLVTLAQSAADGPQHVACEDGGRAPEKPARARRKAPHSGARLAIGDGPVGSEPV